MTEQCKDLPEFVQNDQDFSDPRRVEREGGPQ